MMDENYQAHLEPQTLNPKLTPKPPLNPDQTLNPKHRNPKDLRGILCEGNAGAWAPAALPHLQVRSLGAGGFRV